MTVDPIIYESPDGGYTVYARKPGESERKLVSRANPDPRTPDGRPLFEHMQEDKLWGEIRRTARTNPALQKALDQCIMIYHLSKKHGNSKET